MNLICSEFTISLKKWICFSIHRPPSTGNIKTYFEEIKEVISKALCKYENLITMGDFNIDMKILILTRISWKIFAIFLI